MSDVNLNSPAYQGTPQTPSGIPNEGLDTSKTTEESPIPGIPDTLGDQQEVSNLETKTSKPMAKHLPSIPPPRDLGGLPPLGPDGLGNPCFNPSFLTEYKSLMQDVLNLMLKLAFQESQNATKLITLSNELSQTISMMTKDAGKLEAWKERFQGFTSIVQGAMSVGTALVKDRLTDKAAKDGYNAELEKKNSDVKICKKNVETSRDKLADAENKLHETATKINQEFPSTRLVEKGKLDKEFLEQLPSKDVQVGSSNILTAGEARAKYESALAEVKNARAEFTKATNKEARAEAEVKNYTENKSLHIAQNKRSLAESRGIDSITRGIEHASEAFKSLGSSIFTEKIAEAQAAMKLSEGYLQMVNRMLDSSLEKSRSAKSDLKETLDKMTQLSSENARTFNIRG